MSDSPKTKQHVSTNSDTASRGNTHKKGAIGGRNAHTTHHDLGSSWEEMGNEQARTENEQAPRGCLPGVGAFIKSATYCLWKPPVVVVTRIKAFVSKRKKK